MHSGTFLNILHEFWNILEHSGTVQICTQWTNFNLKLRHTDLQTDIRICWASSQLKTLLLWQDHQREIQGTWPIILGKICINEVDEVIDDSMYMLCYARPNIKKIFFKFLLSRKFARQNVKMDSLYNFFSYYCQALLQVKVQGPVPTYPQVK